MRIFLQLFVITLVFIGEALSVYAELLGAEKYSAGGRGFFWVFLPMFAMITLAGACLVTGYILGYLSFRNIWIISALSLCSILVVEPFLSWIIFHQLPTRGALIALLLGILGLLFALFDLTPLK